MAAVAENGEAKPVLLDLFELEPTGHQVRTELATRSLVAQEPQIPQDAFVQGLVLGLLTVEQQEGINKQRQVRGDRHVEGAVHVEHARLNAQVLREVELHSSQ